MASEFTYVVPDATAVLHTLRQYLRSLGKHEAATLLENARCNISTSGNFSHIRWDGYATTVTFYVPVSILSRFTADIRQELLALIDAVIPKDAGLDVTLIQVSPLLEAPLDDEIMAESEQHGEVALPKSGDAFKRQFPAGLPFGLRKPSLALVPRQGTQRASFEDEDGIGVLRENVYPDFTHDNLVDRLGESSFMVGSAYKRLLSLCQTEPEREFFQGYYERFRAIFTRVPALIPQAWIQWHSKPKRDLREQLSTYADDLYRVDFVAFWNWRRFAILADDIGHYGKQIAGRWDASEEAYTKRLKEDRKLRKEGWQVFRVSNWELRRVDSITQIFDDLRQYMGFEQPPAEEEIPF